jgi:hypothetical protein
LPINSIIGFELPDYVPESSKGYFGLFSIAVAFFGFIFIRKTKPLINAYLVLAICILMVCLQSVSQHQLGVLASSAAWQLRDTLLIISTIFIALLLSALGDASCIKPYSQKIVRVIAVLAVSLSAVFPVYLIVVQARAAGFANGIIPISMSHKNNEWINKLRNAGVAEGDRIYIANSDLFRFASWSGYEKLPQFVDINVATINGWPKIRSAFTLAKSQAGYEAKFYNVIDSRFGCRPHELGFLAVDWVIDSNGECYGDYLREFGEDGVTIINVGRNGTSNESKSVFLYRLNQRNTYVAGRANLFSDSRSCALLVEDDCLFKLGIDPVSIGSKYFNLCLQSCVAEIHWYSHESNSQLVVPLDYQPFFKIVNTRTNLELEASSINGLLRIDPGENTKYGDSIKILLRPDALMLTAAICTWFSAAALMLMCVLLFIKKKRLF